MVRPKVVIIGGGFGGLYTAKKLASKPVDVTIIDRKNHHLFQPLLYQVATAGLSPAEIAVPIRQIFEKHRNISVLMAEVVGFDLAARKVHLRDFTMDYDYLVVASGSTHSYFGHNEYEPYAPGLKTIEDAIEIRRRVLLAFEIAEREAIALGEHRPLNFVVIGGGPTGVELAGTLAEVARRALADDFRYIDPRRTRIILCEAAPKVLGMFPEDLSRSAEEQLEKLGVEVIKGKPVTNVLPDRVVLGDTEIPSTVTLWGAGVSASPLGRALGAPIDRAGRVLVEPDCTIPGHPEVFVIGDLAAYKDAEGKMLPGLAPVAIQQGQFVGNCILNDLHGKPRRKFTYRDKGSLATIGRAAAVGTIGRLHVTGVIAWLTWLFVHLMYLVGFRNRLLVFFDWAYSYTTMERGARLITGSTHLPSAEPAEVAATEQERTKTIA